MPRDADRQFRGGEVVVGVLGGMGPRATWAFCQALTNALSFDKEWEHPRVIVDCDTQIPSRTRCLLYGEDSPAPAMVEGIDGLADMGADFVAVPCNQAHHWYDEVAGQIEIPWLSMVDAVAREVSKRGARRPLVLGGYVTLRQRVYSKVLSGAVYPAPDWEKKIWERIEAAKLDRSRGCLDDLPLSEILARHGADLAVVACTELWGRGAVNSLEVYARAVADESRVRPGRAVG